MTLKLLFAAVGILAMNLTGPAHAAAPAAVYQGFAQAQNYYGVNGGTNGDPHQNLVGSVAGSLAYAFPNTDGPSFRVTGTSGDPGFYYNVNPDSDLSSTSAYAFLYYYFTVNGGSGAVPVDFDYALRANTAATGVYSFGTRASASLVLNNSSKFQYLAESGYPNSTNTPQSLAGTFTADLTFGAVNEIDLYVSDQTHGGPASTSSAEAYVDPRIYIDPAYLATHPGVTLDISAGVGNIGPAAAVPEPASWLMMISGFGAVGGVIRRRRISAPISICH